MKPFLTLFLCATMPLAAFSGQKWHELPPDAFIQRMATVIWTVEGGKNTRFPYGIKSISVKDEADARRICINSIKNNWKRWNTANRPCGFVDWMANRWCPIKSDPVGHKNWVQNVTKLVGKIPD